MDCHARSIDVCRRGRVTYNEELTRLSLSFIPLSCSLYDLYPARANSTDDAGNFVAGVGPGYQALHQFLAGVVTMLFAVVGGGITGYILRLIGDWQSIDQMTARAQAERHEN